MITGQQLYEQHCDLMKSQNILVEETFGDLDEQDRIAWNGLADFVNGATAIAAPVEPPQIAEVKINPDKQHLLDVYAALGVKWGEDPFAKIKQMMHPSTLNLKVEVDQSEVAKILPGLTNLLTTIDTFLTLMPQGVKLSDMQEFIERLRNDFNNLGVEKEKFYHFDGSPAKFDIDEELGMMLLMCQRALDFIHRGPPFITSEADIQALYEKNVVNVIPKLNIMIRNRITVQLPYSKLVDDTFEVRNKTIGREFDGLKRCQVTIRNMANVATALLVDIPEPGEEVNSQSMMWHLAELYEHMTQIMVLFGWTLDDVKLTSRQNLGKHLT